MRRLVSGDLDLGIIGLDTVNEYGQGNKNLILVHEALDYGDCHLSVAFSKYGRFENINSFKELAEMPQWTPERLLRVAIGFTYLGPKFMKENGLKRVIFSSDDGALEAAPMVRGKCGYLAGQISNRDSDEKKLFIVVGRRNVRLLSLR